jgi:hypothetical protein
MDNSWAVLVPSGSCEWGHRGCCLLTGDEAAEERRAARGSRADLHVGWDGSCRLRGVEVSKVSEVSEAEAEAGVGSVRTMMGRARSERAGEATEEALTHPDHGSGDLIDVERDTPQQRVLQAGPGLGRLKRGVSSARRQTAPHCTALRCTHDADDAGWLGWLGWLGCWMRLLLMTPFAEGANGRTQDDRELAGDPAVRARC